METKQCRQALDGLKKLIRALDKAGVWDKVSFREWRKSHAALMEDCLAYKREPGMPPVTALVSAFFHPELPLIGLNYTPVAHNTLHAFPRGWTPALRLCRGIVFDRRGELVAKPFEKFFNYGEHAETRNLPDEAFTATVKHDGHLGIIFECRNAWHITTRGDFTSRSSKIGAEMLRHYVQRGDWDRKLPCGDNLLVEIIHPSTKVHLKYRGSRFILIGAFERDTLRDLDHEDLRALGKRLGLPVTERWDGRSIKDLVALTQDLSVRNKEGFVVRFRSGLRVKFKFASYINLMVAGKLSYTYLMNRMLSGNLEKMIQNLPEEIYDRASHMVDAINKALAAPGTEKERRQRLYGLVPKEESTQYYRGICRKLIKKLDAE